MEWVETTGRTVEEAKDAALDQLGVDDTDAEFVVLTEPRQGLFGRMRGEARVRARVKPTTPRPKRGRTRRTGQEQRRSSRTPRANAGPAATASVAVVESEGAADDAGGTSSGANGSSPGHAQGQAASGTRSRRRRRSRGRGGSSGSGQAGGGQHSEGGQGSGDRRKTVDEKENLEMSLSFEEQGESAREFVEGLLRELGLPAEVTVRAVDESTAEVAVDGSELGILVGPGGATLGALQELTRTVVQKRTGGRSERILVDVAGYRARRAEALQRFTRQIADEVLSSGSERALEPMSAADRKVVHDTVNDMSGVQTRSEGEDPRRYIVISPSGSGTDSDTGSATDSDTESEDD